MMPTGACGTFLNTSNSVPVSSAAATTGAATASTTAISSRLPQQSSIRPQHQASTIPQQPTPLIVPHHPSASGYFLYPGGANGEFTALPLAPINSGPMVPTGGLLNMPLVPPQRLNVVTPTTTSQTFTHQTLAAQPAGDIAAEESDQKASDLKTPVKKLSASGFFPAHSDAIQGVRVCF